MHVVNTFRTSKRLPKFCIDLKAHWLLISDEVGRKSPGYYQLSIKLKSEGNTNQSLHIKFLKSFWDKKQAS